MYSKKNIAFSAFGIFLQGINLNTPECTVCYMSKNIKRCISLGPLFLWGPWASALEALALICYWIQKGTILQVGFCFVSFFNTILFRSFFICFVKGTDYFFWNWISFTEAHFFYKKTLKNLMVLREVAL
jgi:hypothetical protein